MPLFLFAVLDNNVHSRIYPPALLIKILPLDKYVSAGDSATLPITQLWLLGGQKSQLPCFG